MKTLIAFDPVNLKDEYHNVIIIGKHETTIVKQLFPHKYDFIKYYDEIRQPYEDEDYFKQSYKSGKKSLIQLMIRKKQESYMIYDIFSLGEKYKIDICIEMPKWNNDKTNIFEFKHYLDLLVIIKNGYGKSFHQYEYQLKLFTKTIIPVEYTGSCLIFRQNRLTYGKGKFYSFNVYPKEKWKPENHYKWPNDFKCIMSIIFLWGKNKHLDISSWILYHIINYYLS